MIMGKLDRNHDSLIDKDEWVSQLNELFRFMNSTAFEKHAAELLTTASHHTLSRQQQHTTAIQKVHSG